MSLFPKKCCVPLIVYFSIDFKIVLSNLSCIHSSNLNCPIQWSLDLKMVHISEI